MAIVVPIISEWNPSGVNRSIADVKKAEGAWGKTGAGFKAAFAPALGVLGGLGAAALKFGSMAADDAKAQATLANALRNTTKATDSQVASVEEWISAQGKALGVADDDLRPALATLAAATKDVGKAQELSGLAMDLAASKGISLETASNALAKAYTGNVTSLGKLVPGIDKAALASKDFGAVTTSLAGIVGGAAATAADTTAGKWERTQLALSETAESIGAALIPVFDQLIGVVSPLVDWLGQNTDVVVALGAAAGALAAVIVGVNVAMKAWAAGAAIVKGASAAWTAVQWLLNAALTANPIGLIVAGIAALVAGLVLAWNKSDTFRAVVTAAFEKVKSVATTVFNFVKDLVTRVFGGVWDFISGIVDKIRGAFDSVRDAVGNVLGGIADVVRNIPVIGGLLGGAPPAGAPSSRMARAAGMAAGGGSMTVNVHGAVDPEATGRYLRSVIAGSDSRQGRDYGTRRAVAW